MISYREALAKIAAEVGPLEPTSLPVDECLFRSLSESVKAPFDAPRFDNSAVDGYAVRAIDLAQASPESPVELPLCGKVQAGDAGSLAYPEGSTVQVLTGAAIPSGFDAMVMQEDVSAENGSVRFVHPAERGAHVRWQGEEYRTGHRLFEAGTRITPQLLASLAGLGMAQVPVTRPPKLGILATGNELAEPGASLSPGGIYESNSFGIEAAAKTLGLTHVVRDRAKDDPDETRAKLEALLLECDCVVTTGGVSVGEHDLVRAALGELGVREVFWRVAIKPGKPVAFGVWESEGRRRLVFGLPGNPVSALVTFALFAVPALGALNGNGFQSQPEWPATLASELHKAPGRMEFVRCELEHTESGLLARPIEARGSHMLGSMGGASGLIHLPQNAEHVSAGSRVTVSPFDWRWP
ncbi:MAG: molybdopterin molybdotransferase MoeA [Armatimonadetes bacterium]|nr:molybdopterin molybdotransferase MoeA [Armatimonadota bacterium]